MRNFTVVFIAIALLLSLAAPLAAQPLAEQDKAEAALEWIEEWLSDVATVIFGASPEEPTSHSATTNEGEESDPTPGFGPVIDPNN